MQNRTWNWLLTAATAFFLISVLYAQHPHAIPTARKDEYEVFATVLDWLTTSGKAHHPLVADQTSSLSCGGSICNGFEIGGCNGLRAADETPSERLKVVKRDLMDLHTVTITDFQKVNQSCSAIHGKIPATATYYTFAASQLPQGWEHPDLVYLSRVGFNPEHTQALANVSLMSGTSASDSEGVYLLFQKRNGKWVVSGSSAVWQLSPPQ